MTKLKKPEKDIEYPYMPHASFYMEGYWECFDQWQAYHDQETEALKKEIERWKANCKAPTPKEIALEKEIKKLKETK